MPKVLVVEDQPSVVAIVRYHLESAGFEGVFAGDVEEAWRHIVRESPDVAVLDIKLPGSDGWSLLQKIRSDGRYHRMPVVVLTGLLEPEIAERAATMGADYLSKPFAASALLSKIKGLVGTNGVGAGSPNGAPKPPPAPSGFSPKIELVAVGVVLLLDGYQVEGDIYLPPELGRFSDAWESVIRDNREFVPVTNCTVSSADGGTPIASPSFVEVRKSHIRAVFPKDITS